MLAGFIETAMTAKMPEKVIKGVIAQVPMQVR